jgi:hypothetical protein
VPRNQRFILLGLSALVLVVAVIAIGSGGDDSSISTTTSATTATPTTGSTPTTASTPAKPEPATVVIRAGKPVGGVQKVTFKKGGTIDLIVTSDTADEVHFHGYDVAKDVAKGGSVRFRFPAKIDGRFVVELENRRETIANVTVEP